MLDSKQVAHSRPQGRRELDTPVRRNDRRYAKAGDPVVEEGRGAGGGGGGGQGHSFRQAAGMINNGEKVSVTGDDWQRPTIWMLMWVKLWVGTGIAAGGGWAWVTVLACCQGRYSVAHIVFCLALCGHTKRDEISCFMARRPGLPALCSMSKIRRWKGIGAGGKK
jgi:hypothetical protein